jgi:hypothetical protein
MTCSNSLNDHNPRHQPKLFSTEQHEAFDRDGFLLVSNMLDVTMLKELVNASNDFVSQTKKMKAYFSSVELGMIFQAGETNRTVTEAFRHVALNSILPHAAAELMRLDPSQRVRVIRYAILLLFTPPPLLLLLFTRCYDNSAN